MAKMAIIPNGRHSQIECLLHKLNHYADDFTPR